MSRVFAAAATKFAKLESRCRLLLVLVSYIIAAFAVTALERNVVSRHITFLDPDDPVRALARTSQIPLRQSLGLDL